MSIDISGDLRVEADGTGTVHMERVYDTDIDDLWDAMTDPARLRRWLADVEGDPTVGVTVHGTFTSSWTGAIRIDVCEAPFHLRVTMEPGPDENIAEAWLTADGARTRLVLEERGFSLDEVADHGAGWRAHVEDLAAEVAGRPGGDWSARWAELRPGYGELVDSLR